jgi:hypothetical protein
VSGVSVTLIFHGDTCTPPGFGVDHADVYDVLYPIFTQHLI